jgi:hypothetical protein
MTPLLLCAFRQTGTRRVERERSLSKNPKMTSESKRWVDDPLKPSKAIDHTSRAIAFLRLRKRHSDPNAGSVPSRKNRREARAALFTHQLGWEVRLLIGAQLEVVRTQVCRGQEEMVTTGSSARRR